MAITQLAPPAIGALIFRFEDLWCPEGIFRITLWRNFEALDSGRFGFPSYINFLDPSLESITITLRGALITKLPIYEEETENYFTEITTNGFELGIYNTNSYSDIISVVTTISQPHAPIITFGPSSDDRLLWKYLKPTELTELYGQWEFKPHDNTSFDPAVVGECQNAIEGEDYRWYHADENNPYLDERLNAPVDAEQIFDFKFVHSVHAALEKTPVMPNTQFNASTIDTWNMPTWNGYVGLPGNPTYDRIPAIRYAEHIGSSSFVDPGKKCNPRWKGYIDAYYWLKIVFDYAYGANKWNFECEVSPLTFEGAQLVPMIELANWNDGQKIKQSPSGVKRTVRVDKPGQLFLPQGLWNAYKDWQAYNIDGIPVSMWPLYLQSAWDSIWEFCICFGWIPIVWKDEKGIAQIYFKDRTTPFQDEFAGPVPTTAKPTAFPESESGISVGGYKTFLNGRANDGWYDDILAYKRGPAGAPETITEQKEGVNNPTPYVLPVQANPYVVPSTAKKPAAFNCLMRFGGYEWFVDDNTANPQPNPVRFYGTDLSPRAAGFYGMTYTPLVPLVPGDDVTSPFVISPVENWDLDPSWPYPVDTGPGVVGPLPAPIRDYRPVMRGYFSYTDANGIDTEVTNDSFRQMLARFYAVHFVKSARKYVLEDATINQFWLLNSTTPKKSSDPQVGDRIGSPSWQNVKLFRQRLMPDGKRYYLKHRTVDPNSMKTTTEYLRVEAPNSLLLNGKFDDDTEVRGKLPTDAPPNDGGGGISPSGG